MNALKKAPKPLLFIGGALLYGSSTFAFYKCYNNNSGNSNSPDSEGQICHINTTARSCNCKLIDITSAQREERYGDIAKTYDSDIGWDEIFMGIGLVRWWLLGKAKGNVLEIGCGTGRNFQHYPKEVTRLVATDTVMTMLEQAKRKIMPRNPYHYRAELIKMDSHDLKFAPKSFDTCVDTFGLCSYDDPVAVLKEMGRCCKDGGRILLIEHGRGSYEWINDIIDSGAQSHAEKWGCVWNKDIEGIVRQAGLEIKSIHRLHFGTTYIIEACPIPIPPS